MSFNFEIFNGISLLQKKISSEFVMEYLPLCMQNMEKCRISQISYLEGMPENLIQDTLVLARRL